MELSEQSSLLMISFLFGLLIGSFLNVCIYRIPRHESIMFTGSHCISCGMPIKFYDLFPVVSYFILKGRCRTCSSVISPRYPCVEFITAVLIAAQLWKWGTSVSFLLFAALTSLLIVVAMVDLEHQLIEYSLIVSIAVLGMAYQLSVRIPQAGLAALADSVLGFFLGGVLFLVISIVSRGGMGGADIMLAAALGLWFGWKLLLLLLLAAFLSGALISVFLLLMHRKSRKDCIPFGPFLALSAFAVSLFGSELLQWYFGYMLR